MPRTRSTVLAGLSAGALALAVVTACSAADGLAERSDPGPVPSAMADAVPRGSGELPDRPGAATAADGWLPDGASLSPADTGSPAVGRLDPALLTAVQQAARAAAESGVDVRITSGWRSADLQAELLADAVRRYGSIEEARRWVKTPEESTHVSGRAVDVASADAASWLSQRGDEFGLCQTYANELWHYELAVTPGDPCPAPLDDAAG